MNSIDTHARLRAYTLQERRQVIIRSRLFNGFLRLFRQPWTMLFPLLLMVTVTFAWANRSKFALPGNISPEWEKLWQLTLSVLITLLSLLILWGTLTLLGTPRHTAQIEAALAHAGLIDRYGLCPALLSVRRVKNSSVLRLTFWSKGIQLETWAEKERAIEDVLNFHTVKPAAYGGRKGNDSRRIVLTLAPGVRNQPVNPIYDDDF